MLDSVTACFIAFLAGALRVASPDHWVPISLIAWRRDWSATRTVLSGLMVSAAHLGLGYLIYRAVFWNLTGSFLNRETGLAVLLIAVLRLLMFRRRVGGLLASPASAPDRSWISILSTSLTFVGPAELFAVALTIPDPRVSFYFAIGSLMTPGIYAAVGTRLWNRPLGLSRGLSVASGSPAWIPLGFFAVVGWLTLN